MSYNRNNSGRGIVNVVLTLIFLSSIAGALKAWPTYRVWLQEMRGKAALAEAKQNRQILIEEAEANLAAEKLNAMAEIERAKGMAQAMEIENEKLNNEYIHYLWIRQLDKTDAQKIYIPTEAGLPILEAWGQ